MAAFLAVARPLFWLVVKRRALVNNMNRYELEGLVAYHLECSVSHITTIYASWAGWYRHLLAVGSFSRPALNEVKCLFTVMDMKCPQSPGHFLDACNVFMLVPVRSDRFNSFRLGESCECAAEAKAEASKRLKKIFHIILPIVL